MANDPTTKTALDLITGALRKIGQYAPGEVISAADANDALDTFNGLLDLWSSQKLSVFNVIETVLNLTAGQSTYTMGVGGYFPIEQHRLKLRRLSMPDHIIGKIHQYRHEKPAGTVAEDCVL